MDFAQVNGRLNYHNDVLSATGVTLDWRGLPLTLNVAAKQKTDVYNVSIETLGQWQDKQWQQQLPAELVKYGQGQLTWQGVLSLNISDENFKLDENYILVKDTLETLQKLAKYHRSQLKIPIIGITGSNGKTIVKEWLFQLLREVSDLKNMMAKQSDKQPIEPKEQFLSIEEAAEFINLTVPTIYSKVSRRTIPYMKRGKRLYFSTKDLTNWLKSSRVKTYDEISAKARAVLNGEC